MGAFWNIPYGVAHPTGFWGEQTSAVNFCEEDYLVTSLVAEFFNTVTSLLYIAYGIHGIRRFKRKDISVFAPVNLTYWGLIGVGVGSTLYHMTLKYHTQMSDELSMHVAVGAVVHSLFTFEQPPARQRLVRTIILGILIPFYIYHCLADEFTLHVIIFLTMILLTIYKTRLLIKSRVQDPAQKQRLSSLVNFGAFCAALAYALWNVDVHFCPLLMEWKRKVGMPWGVVLELHGWWHVLTAITSYTFVTTTEFLTCPYEDMRETKGEGFAWPATQVMRDLARPVADGLSKADEVVANGKVREVVNGTVERVANGKVANGKAH